MIRFLSALLFLSIMTTMPAAAPVPSVVPPDSLPKGATARLGSLTLRGPRTHGLTFSPDGKKLYSAYLGQVNTWIAETGRWLSETPYLPSPIETKNGSTTYKRSGSTKIVGDRIVTLDSLGGAPGEVKVIVASLTDGKELKQFQFRADLFGSYYPHTFDIDAIAGQFTSCGVSPDGKHLAIITSDAARNGAASVFDLDSGELIRSHKLASWRESGVYVTPDSKSLIVRDEGKPLRRFDLATGKELQSFDEGASFVNRLVVSPDGKLAVTSGYRADETHRTSTLSREEEFLTVWDTTTGKSTGRLEVGAHPWHPQFAGSDALILIAIKGPESGAQYTLSRWNLKTLKQEWSVPCPTSKWLTVSPDGKLIAVTNHQHTLFLYDAATGKPTVGLTGHAAGIAWVGFSSDSEVTTVGGKELMLWGTEGERKKVLALSEGQLGGMPWDGVGNHLIWITPGKDGKSSEILSLAHNESEPLWRMPLEGKPPQKLFTHDGKQVLGAAFDDTKKRWEATVYDGPTGKRLGRWTVPHAVVQEEGKAKPNPFRKEPEKGKTKTTVSERDFPPMALSGDGKMVFVGGDGVVGLDPLTGERLVQIATGRVASVRVSPNWPLSATPLAVSPDGSRIALVNEKSIRAFDVKSGKLLGQHQADSMLPMTKFSPDGKLLAV